MQHKIGSATSGYQQQLTLRWWARRTSAAIGNARSSAIPHTCRYGRSMTQVVVTGRESLESGALGIPCLMITSAWVTVLRGILWAFIHQPIQQRSDCAVQAATRHLDGDPAARRDKVERDRRRAVVNRGRCSVRGSSTAPWGEPYAVARSIAVIHLVEPSPLPTHVPIWVDSQSVDTLRTR